MKHNRTKKRGGFQPPNKSKSKGNSPGKKSRKSQSQSQSLIQSQKKTIAIKSQKSENKI